jgi:hypothetical protein
MSDKRTLEDINSDYFKLCAFMGDFLVKALFENKAIIAKYTEYKLLKREADELKKVKSDE